jgi:hypothetical protein
MKNPDEMNGSAEESVELAKELVSITNGNVEAILSAIAATVAGQALAELTDGNVQTFTMLLRLGRLIDNIKKELALLQAVE